MKTINNQVEAVNLDHALSNVEDFGGIVGQMDFDNREAVWNGFKDLDSKKSDLIVSAILKNRIDLLRNLREREILDPADTKQLLLTLHDEEIFFFFDRGKFKDFNIRSYESYIKERKSFETAVKPHVYAFIVLGLMSIVVSKIPNFYDYNSLGLLIYLTMFGISSYLFKVIPEYLDKKKIFIQQLEKTNIDPEVKRLLNWIRYLNSKLDKFQRLQQKEGSDSDTQIVLGEMFIIRKMICKSLSSEVLLLKPEEYGGKYLITDQTIDRSITYDLI